MKTDDKINLMRRLQTVYAEMQEVRSITENNQDDDCVRQLNVNLMRAEQSILSALTKLNEC